MAIFVKHEECPKCSSRDNLARYDDGSGYCFGCKYHEGKDGIVVGSLKLGDGMVTGEIRALEKRHISEKTCRFYDYRCGVVNNKQVQIANYKDEKGVVISQKLRTADKKFSWTGEDKNSSLFGKWIWTPNKKLGIVVTEGEIDAMSVNEAQNCAWPVVSISTGAGPQAISQIKKELEYLNGFRHVTFLFDSDEVGQKTAKECAQLFAPGKASISTLPMKDANEMLVAGKKAELLKCILNAKEYRPDGLVKGNALTREFLLEPLPKGYDIPHPELNRMLRGLHKRRLMLITAGTGCGKTTLAKELAYHLVVNHKLKVGCLFLEESLKETGLSLIALDNNVSMLKLMDNPAAMGEDKFNASYEKIYNNDRLIFYDHFGSDSTDVLLSKIEYLAVAEKVDFIVLDHISLVVSGTPSSKDGERKDIDILMTNLRSLIHRTGVGVIAGSQLIKVGNSKGPEDGGSISIGLLRGSGSIGHVCDAVVAIERDDESENSKLKVLKNRVGCVLGYADTLKYNIETGRLEDDATGMF